MANGPAQELNQWLASFYSSRGARRSFLEKRPVSVAGEPLPWMTYPAIAYFEQLDLSDAVIFEYGSGFGSRYWASRAAKVISVEDSEDWAEQLRPHLRANQSLLLRMDADAYAAAIDEAAEAPDIVIIDGNHRQACARAVLKRFKPPLIIFDNSDWYPKTCEILSAAGLLQVDFVGPGPINSYAWSTSAFFDPASTLRRRQARPSVAGGIDQVGDEV